MNRMNREEFQQFLTEKVQVHALDEAVILTRAENEGVQGTFSYTTGLTEVFGFELVAFGAFDVEDLLASAKMIHSNFPRGVAVEIPFELLKEMHASLPELQYRQYVMDESALEDDTDKPSEEPMWIADGGYPILTDVELQAKLTHELDKREAEVKGRMEAVRQQYRDKIEANGFTMVGVFDHNGNAPNYVYTVGLTNKDLPELVVSGRFDMDFLAQVVGSFAEEMIKDGFALRRRTDVFTLQEGDSAHDIRMVEVDPVHAKENFLVQAEPILKAQVRRVVQLQISDGKKKFFGDEGFDHKLGHLDIAPVIAGGYPSSIEA